MVEEGEKEYQHPGTVRIERRPGNITSAAANLRLGLNTFSVHFNRSNFAMPTVPPSQLPSSPSSARTYSSFGSRRSGSDTDAESHPSPPSSDIYSDSDLRTPSPVGPPSLVSVAGGYSPDRPAAYGVKSPLLREAVIDPTVVVDAIPQQFWKLLDNTSIDYTPLLRLMNEIWALRWKWLGARVEVYIYQVAYYSLETGVCTDYIQRVANVDIVQYKLLHEVIMSPILENIEETEGKLYEWGMFLRRLKYVYALFTIHSPDLVSLLSIDFWPNQNELIMSAPHACAHASHDIAVLFKELHIKLGPPSVMRPIVTEISMVSTKEVYVSNTGKVLQLDSDEEMSGENTVELFFCDEGFTEEEFGYQAMRLRQTCHALFDVKLTKNVAQASHLLEAMPSISGVFLSLVMSAREECPKGDLYGMEDYPSDWDPPLLEVAFVFYDRANLEKLKSTAQTAQSIADWERGNPHLMVSCYASSVDST